MPPLRMLGRDWRIATDDLPLPSLMGAAWHLCWVPIIAVELDYVINQLAPDCSTRKYQIGYLSAQMFLFPVLVILYTWLFFESKRGPIFGTRQRRRVGPLVLTVSALYLATMFVNIFGTRVLADIVYNDRCPQQPGNQDMDYVALFKAIVIATWVAFMIAGLAIIITLNLSSSYERISVCFLQLRVLQVLCCCCLGREGGEHHRAKQAAERAGGRAKVEGHEQAVAKDNANVAKTLSPAFVIASVFVEVFGGVEMTLTDFIAAFALVGTRHRFAKPALSYRSEPPPAWLTKDEKGVGAAPGPGGVASTAVITTAPPVIEIAARSGPQPDPSSSNGSKAPMLAATHGSGGSEETPTTVTTTIAPTTSLPGAPGTPQDATAAKPAPVSQPSGLRPSHTSDMGELSPLVAARGLLDGAASALTEATARVFGHSIMPNGQVPVFLDPRREWNGEAVESNASVETMDESIHYLRFAMAVYGWKMYMWMYRMEAGNWCNLCLGRGCGCCRQMAHFFTAVGPDTGPSEGCCTASKMLEREAITQLTGVEATDVLYVCYDNIIGGLLPYYIAIDRQRQAVVVGIRGSLSLRDVVTDLLCVPAPYDVPGVPSMDANGKRQMWGHRGMVQSALDIAADLEQQGILDAVLGEWPAEAAQQAGALQRLPSERARAAAQRLAGTCAGWRLVITGHSLGAGVTGLLGPLLRVKYPNMRCWAFAPPGGLMSPKAAELTREFCVSVVSCKDVIPRLGVTQMENMVQELVTASAYCRVPKLDIMARLIMLGWRPDQSALFAPAERLQEEAKQALANYAKYLEACKVNSQYDDARGFLPPGRVLYVERHKPDTPPPCCSCNLCLVDRSAESAAYVCRWIRTEDLMRGGLVVSRSMFMDHLPDNTIKAMMNAYKQLCEVKGVIPNMPHLGQPHAQVQVQAQAQARSAPSASPDAHGHPQPHAHAHAQARLHHTHSRKGSVQPEPGPWSSPRVSGEAQAPPAGGTAAAAVAASGAVSAVAEEEVVIQVPAAEPQGQEAGAGGVGPGGVAAIQAGDAAV
ncbi:hypothetical protein HYH03_008419 [Edaphochlamys debaryana]|uniref:sn-1-specific diacylglycerol lipase n=1 Tax=Edaphochlamys debaryana TaxID=47281 RepID=A0A835Y253_9CHLO|nr:hypothetical protein HYH03_008419 [Edaphochlamys debaryana]|eukprot:KAG2493283.1 hypothetical protein HYH03_008419 [Edaphochlamys debaryana]